MKEIKTYEICNTNQSDHLYGSIIIHNIDDASGYAIVIMKDLSPDTHGSIEEIVCRQGDGVFWELKKGFHTRNLPRGGGTQKQKWTFELNKPKGRSEFFHSHRYINNGYTDYIEYFFTPYYKDTESDTKGMAKIFEGNGSGTGGNHGSLP